VRSERGGDDRCRRRILGEVGKYGIRSTEVIRIATGPNHRRPPGLEEPRYLSTQHSRCSDDEYNGTIHITHAVILDARSGITPDASGSSDQSGGWLVQVASVSKGAGVDAVPLALAAISRLRFA
jgi:hypothetical protein